MDKKDNQPQDNESPDEDSKNTKPSSDGNEGNEESVDALQDRIKGLQAQVHRHKKRHQELKETLEQEDDSPSDKDVSRRSEAKDDYSESTWKERMEFVVQNRDIAMEDVDLLESLRRPNENLSEVKERSEHLLRANQEKRQTENKSFSPSSPNKDSSFKLPSSEEMDEIVKDPQKHKEWEEKAAEYYSRPGSKKTEI